MDYSFFSSALKLLRCVTVDHLKTTFSSVDLLFVIKADGGFRNAVLETLSR